MRVCIGKTQKKIITYFFYRLFLQVFGRQNFSVLYKVHTISYHLIIILIIK